MKVSAAVMENLHCGSVWSWPALQLHEDIEVRICGDQNMYDEDTFKLIALLELFVQ